MRIDADERLPFKDAYFVKIAKILNQQVYKRYPSLRSQIRYKLDDLAAVFSKYRGRCAFCGIALTPYVKKGNTVYFGFYVPLKYGGSPSPDNLIVTCYVCRMDINPTQR